MAKIKSFKNSDFVHLHNHTEYSLLDGLTKIPQLIQDTQKFNAAVAGMQNLLSLYDQAGGAQGPVGGILASLQSVLGGGEASRFNASATRSC